MKFMLCKSYFADLQPSFWYLFWGHILMKIAVQYLVLVSLWQGSDCIGDDALLTTLHDDLLDHYNPSVRPICKNGPRFVNVSLDVALRQILHLNEKQQILASNMWVRMSWTDCQLKWNISQYDSIDSLRIPYSKIWIPDISLYDSSAEEVMLPGLGDYRAQVHSDGTVKYNFPTVLHSVCRVKVTYFPFDTQECGLKFGSWSHSQLDIDFYPSSLTGDLGAFMINNEWIVKEITAQRSVVMYSEPYSDVNFVIIMIRRPDHYVMTMLFPCILIGATAAIGFLLPPESGEKVSLEVTVLLSQAVFLLVISDFLPPSADNFPILGIYFAVSMLLVGLSLVMSVLVLNVHHRGDVKGKTVPSWARRYLLQNPRLQCSSNKYDVDGMNSKENDNKAFSMCHSRKSSTTSIFLGGRNYQLPNSRPDPSSGSNGDVKNQEITETSIQTEKASSKNTFGPSDSNNLPEKLQRNNSVHNAQHTIDQQLPVVALPKEHRRMLRNIERHFTLSDEEESVQEDWQKLARIIDRFCLLLYIICFSIVTIVYVFKLLSRGDDPKTKG